jgi:hypothetical protein
VPCEILRVFNTILYENEFQNPELFPTQVSLSPEQSTLALRFTAKLTLHIMLRESARKKGYKFWIPQSM